MGKPRKKPTGFARLKGAPACPRLVGLAGVLFHTMSVPELSRVRTEL
jgi:hypothetical protein